MWEWFESIEIGRGFPPRVEVWPRGGAKSSTGELGCAFVGDRLTRRFCLYVSSTQDQADKHVQHVGTLLESLGYGAAVNKQGHSKGWRRNQLRTSHGFNVAAFGLDTNVRGVKLDEFRPDLIILDDIDDRHDTPEATAKKESIITQTLLPAGSSDVAILFLQNLIIEDGIVARMVRGAADYLLNAEIVGPEPAIEGLQVEDADLPNGRRYKRIVSGTPTWAGQDIERCQRQIIEWGWTAFRRESQHEVVGVDGLFFDVSRLHTVQPEAIPLNLHLCRAWDLAGTQAGGDYTAGVLLGYDEASGQYYVLDVRRAQYASNDVRALVLRTRDGDQQGIVRGPDLTTMAGAFERQGPEVYRFHCGRKVALVLPQDPGQAGKDQAIQYAQLLDDPDAVIRPVTGSKATRASGWQAAVNDGRVSMVAGDWGHAFREEHRRFRADEEHDYDDQVDAAADAFRRLALVAERLRKREAKTTAKRSTWA